MRGRACAALVLALLACGDDDDTKPITDASTPIDGSQPRLDAALITSCGPVMACRDGMLTQLPELCTGSVNAQPSGGIWQVCVVDPQGRTAYIAIRADQRITSPGWTHSNYAFVDATLSDEGYDACLTERSKLLVPTEDTQLDGGSELCYRPNSGIQNDD